MLFAQLIVVLFLLRCYRCCCCFLGWCVVYSGLLRAFVWYYVGEMFGVEKGQRLGEMSVYELIRPLRLVTCVMTDTTDSHLLPSPSPSPPKTCFSCDSL